MSRCHKLPYASRKQASIAAKKIEAAHRHGAIRDRGHRTVNSRRPLVAYWCGHCAAWHTGHQVNPKHVEIQRSSA